MAEPSLAVRQATLLIVDDDDIDFMGIQHALKNLNIMNPVVRAKDGAEAFVLLKEPGAIDRPYIILLDIHMPRMNGIEFLSELRNDPTLSNSIVFVLTASPDDEDKVAAYAQHIAGYIGKQQAVDGFMQVIKTLGHYFELPEP